MDCREFDLICQQHIDMGTDLPAEAMEHAAACPECAAWMAELQQLDALLAAELPVAAPADFVDSVMAALPADLYAAPAADPIAPAEAPAAIIPTVAKKRRLMPWALTACAAAMLAVVGLLGFDAEVAPGPDPIQVASGNEQGETVDPIIDPVDPIIDNNEDNADDQLIDDPTPVVPLPDENIVVAEVDPDPVTYSGTLSMGKVLYGEEYKGMFTLVLLAAHEGVDAVLPKITDDNTATYYLVGEDSYEKWQLQLDYSAAPTYVSRAYSLPKAADIVGAEDESWLFAENYVMQTSPDQTQIVVNRGGAEAGLWVRANNDTAELEMLDIYGGGNILAWAPDSNKILYTDSNNYLRLYYVAEQLSLTVHHGEVSSVCWSADSHTIVFAAEDEDGGNSKIYSIQVP